MDFVIYCVLYMLEAAFGFGMLFAISAAVVWWGGRHRRRELAYENGHT